MKNSRIVFLFIICLTSSTIIEAQIKVATNNCVGIGEDNPVSKFSINYPGENYSTAYILNNKITTSSRGLLVKNDITTSSWGFSIIATTPFTSSSASKNVGIKGFATSSTYISSKRSAGVWGVAGNATSGYNYGLYGELYGTGNGAAVFAVVPGRGDTYINDKYAGYFRGKVFIEDYLKVGTTYYYSDINMKKDIRLLANIESPQIEKLKSLTAIKYKLKTPVELNQIGSEVSDTLSLDIIAQEYNTEYYKKDKIGLSAQDVQQVFPELVIEDEEGYLSINYVGLIPVLIEATKEQQTVIEELQSELLKMKAEMDKLKLVPIK